MPEPVGVTLGAIALIAPVYDACDRAYSGLKIMARFGQDFQTLWRKLEGYWTTLYLLMERNSAHLRVPPDPRDPNHKVTKVILDQLKELTSQFEFCENLIAAQLRKRTSCHGAKVCTDIARAEDSEIDLTQLQSASSESDQTPVSGALSNVTTENETASGPPSSLRPNAVHIDERKLSFLRKATPRFWRERSARRAASPAQRVPESSVQPERSSETQAAAKSVRDALRVLSIEGISNSTSDDNFRRIQQATGTWVHVKWAHHIKAEFERSIVHISDAVHILADILALRDLQDPRSLLRTQSKSAKSPSPALLASQSLLRTVHGAIGRLQKQSGGIPVRLSVATYEDSATVWKQAAQTELESLLGDSGLMLWVQLEDPNVDGQSKFLMIEATQTSQNDLLEQHPPLRALPRISNPSTFPQEDSGYDFLGTVPVTKATQSTNYKLFADKKGWRRLTTLKDFLKRSGPLDDILSSHVLADMFRRLLEAYLTTILIEPSCSNFQTENITYFQPSDQQYDSSNPAWLLQFYVTCGFGQPPAEQRLGMQTGPLKDPNAAIVELGLMLFELGSHQTIEYQTQTGQIMSPTLRSARQASLNNTSQVEVKYGTRVADVVSACLQATSRNHEDVVRAAVMEMRDIREELDRVDPLSE